VNSGGAPQEGVLKGTIEETGGRFEKKVRLLPSETQELVFTAAEHPALRIEKPRLWWPHNYGPQNLYHLALRFEAAGQPCDEERIQFGIRQVTRELHKLDGAHGLRVHVNGQKVFCRGGYIQPELLFDWDARRIEAEIRYLTEANINIVYFEDIPNPPDVFLDLCDRYGLMFGNCFYGSLAASVRSEPRARLSPIVSGKARLIPSMSMPRPKRKLATPQSIPNKKTIAITATPAAA